MSPYSKEGFDFICRVAKAVGKDYGDCLLVVDEVDFYVQPGYAPGPFSELVRIGRHWGVEMICMARRPASVWRNLTANADHLCVFLTHEPRDITYLSEFLTRPVAESLRVLDKFCFIQYSNGEVTRGRTSLL